MKLYHKHVNRNVGMNPVARAVARAKLNESILDAKLKLYLMSKGDPCADFLMGVGQILGVVGYACELDPKQGRDVPALRVLRGGLSACQQLVDTDKWDPLQTVAIEAAIDAAAALNEVVNGRYVAKAWQQIVAAPAQ